jgi:glucose-1-phosphate thymidylyltransferase
MRIIIPMAGIGKRMRPHTLTVPKPLIKIAGKPIVQRLVEDIGEIINKKIDEIAFIVGDFGKEVENNLLSIAENIGTKGVIYHQNEALGTAHAIYCAKESLKGEVIVAFADTLFKANFIPDNKYDGTIWVHKVSDPSLFGVVLTDQNNIISNFIEKPEDFISDLAIVGIYYFKEGESLRDSIKYLNDNNIMTSGEYQLTDALQKMMKEGKKFSTAEVTEWLDCGNKNATVHTNQRILEYDKEKQLISKSSRLTNSIVIPPSYIGENAVVSNSIIGPYVSVGENTKIDRSVISNSIIQDKSKIVFVTIDNSMIGNNVEFKGEINEVSIGDYTQLG